MSNLTITAILATLIGAGSATAIDLPTQCRVRNIGGRCAYASLESAANALGEHRLRGLVNLRGGLERNAHQTSDLGTIDKIRAQMEALDVPCIIEPDYTWNYKTIHRYARSNGVMVAFYSGTPWLEGRTLKQCHAVLLVDASDTDVWFYCPDSPWRIWKGPMGWFEKHWTGSAVVILREQN